MAIKNVTGNELLKLRDKVEGQLHEIGNQIRLKSGYGSREDFKNLIAKLQEAIELKRAKKFTVGKVFRHRDENCVPQYHYDNFANLLKPMADRVISISKAKGKLSEYVLPEDMNDSAIQKAAKSTVMEEDQFLATLYLLIIEPEIGKDLLGYELRKDKRYIFHVRFKSGKVVVVDAAWLDDEWSLRAREFGASVWWCEGSVFLSPAAA